MKGSALANAVWAVAASIVLLPSAARAQARYDDEPPAHRFFIRIGGFLVEEFQTTVRFDSTRVPIGTVIDLEDSLNVDSRARVARIDGQYRFGKKQRLDFGWFQVDRTGNSTVVEEIRIYDPETGEEILIKPGATVLSEVKFDVVNAIYNWSFLNTWRYELFVGAGLNVRDLKLDLVGDFDPGDGQVREERFDAQGLVPLPVVSFGGRWNFSRKWLTTWQWQLFAMRFGDYRGNVQDSVIGFDYDASRNVGFGFGLNKYDLAFDAESDKLRGQLNETYLGLLAYLKIYY